MKPPWNRVSIDATIIGMVRVCQMFSKLKPVTWNILCGLFISWPLGLGALGTQWTKVDIDQMSTYCKGLLPTPPLVAVDYISCVFDWTRPLSFSLIFWLAFHNFSSSLMNIAIQKLGKWRGKDKEAFSQPSPKCDKLAFLTHIAWNFGNFIIPYTISLTIMHIPLSSSPSYFGWKGDQLKSHNSLMTHPENMI